MSMRLGTPLGFLTAQFLSKGVVVAAERYAYRNILGKELTKISEAAKEDTSGSCGLLYPDGRNDTFDIPGNQRKCQRCLKQHAGCKWCPLSQSCMQRGYSWLGGDGGCVAREGHPEDEKIAEDSMCGGIHTPWIEILLETYGKSYQDNPDAYADATRCVQWALDWPVTPDPTMPGSDDTDVGRWGCTSTLIRDGILGMLGETRSPVSSLFESVATHAQFGSLASDGNASASWSWLDDATTWEPKLCSIMMLKLNCGKCYIRSFANEKFGELRKQWALPNGKGPADLSPGLLESVRSGPLVTFSPGAGKSGSGFARTWDNRFKIKLGIKYDNNMNEPRNLLSLLNGGKQSVADADRVTTLAQHLKAHPTSLLNRYYGMIKLRFGDVSSYCLVMADAFYDMADKIPAVAPQQAYDLKGSSRRQDQSKGSGNTLINGDFRTKEGNRLRLGREQCSLFRSAVAADVAFLSAYSIIDYSLLFNVVHNARGAGVTCGQTPGEPFCFEGDDGVLYTVTLIDYLNNFNHYKYLESRFVQWRKFDHYGTKIDNFAEEICPGEKTEQFRSHLEALLASSGGSIRQAFETLDVDGSGSITIEELVAYFREKGFSDADTSKLFAELDEHGDDAISLEEFTSLFRRFGIASTQ